MLIIIIFVFLVFWYKDNQADCSVALFQKVHSMCVCMCIHVILYTVCVHFAMTAQQGVSAHSKPTNDCNIANVFFVEVENGMGISMYLSGLGLYVLY